ncbi:hypothetical protein EX30DRAFT_133265 [Ascodesmis nigricans]|uniref:Uncharacterized protein n=1 Tax=Ascodesmis nigricans TaxID=341454 RepID=A0A4S2MSC1_9PEZI|nr:hypothetical protein EX30DRAFT_133265 [Ascodesmis nigricans]
MANSPPPVDPRIYVSTTTYIQGVVITPPTFCSGYVDANWSHVIAANISIPSAVADQVQYKSTKAMVGYDKIYRVTMYIGASAHPNPVLSTPITSKPSDREEIRKVCASPDATSLPDWLPEDYNDDDNDYNYEVPTRSEGGSLWIIFRNSMIALGVVFGFLLILGFFESYHHFTQLMRGKGALRLGTVSWVFIFIFAACLIRRERRRKNAEEKRRLKEYWERLPRKRRLALWLKHGFTWRYPPFLVHIREGRGENGEVLEMSGVEVVEEVPAGTDLPPPYVKDPPMPPPYGEVLSPPLAGEERGRGR